MNLLPHPRSLRRSAGDFVLPGRVAASLPVDLPRDSVLLPLADRLRTCARASAGVEIELALGPATSITLTAADSKRRPVPPCPAPLPHVGGYALRISNSGVAVRSHDVAGLRHAVATLRQLLREYGRRLPCLVIEDWPDIPHRGVLLDISRGRVPRLETLLELVDRLADFKINELQLYTEHTFAYSGYASVWKDWGAITGEEILRLDERCQQLGIEFVPNQNSFGHLREWLARPRLRQLAEVRRPYAGPGGEFLRHPSTLAPTHPGTLPFLRQLYDQLLPHFTSNRFNVGCDETWDLGLGQSRSLCNRKGKGRVYLDFLLRVHRELRQRDKTMLFWGDIILKYPVLIPDLPAEITALNWGYEADHPFGREAAAFAEAGVPFYVCPGTSTWMTLIGRHDNAFRNLRRAAEAGRQHGAIGYLITDWGDGGHPQPLAVSWPLYVLGAASSWCAATVDGRSLAGVLSRDIYDDPSGRMARAALDLGLAHKQLGYTEPNATPLGAVIAAPPPALREIFCRNGLKHYARIEAWAVLNTRDEIEAQRFILRRAEPQSLGGKLSATELDLAARMAVQSCEFMLWQQALAGGRAAEAQRRSRAGIVALRDLAEDFNSFWPLRSKGTALRHWPLFKWRIADYRRGALHFNPEQARAPVPQAP